MTSYRLHLADEPMSYTVFATFVEALAECRSLFGREMDCETQGRRTLVWASFADAEDDDGANAAAEITEVEDEIARIDVPLAALDTLDSALDHAIDQWAYLLRHEAEHYTDDDCATMRHRMAQAKALCGIIAAARYEARRGNNEGEVIG